MLTRDNYIENTLFSCTSVLGRGAVPHSQTTDVWGEGQPLSAKLPPPLTGGMLAYDVSTTLRRYCIIRQV